MDDILSHLYNARDELQAAEDAAGIGTSLMVGDIRKRLSKLISRTERIHDSDQDTPADEGAGGAR